MSRPPVDAMSAGRHGADRQIPVVLALLLWATGCGRFGYDPLALLPDGGVSTAGEGNGPGSNSGDSDRTDGSANGDGGLAGGSGSPDAGGAVPPSGTVLALGLSVGRDHACVVVTGGNVLCWGVGTGYRLGSGSTADALSPTLVPLDEPAKSVSCGDSHTLALSESGGVFGWGENSFGELGDGTLIDRPTPTPVTGLPSAVVELDSGGDHACVRIEDGNVYCWGYNVQQQVGVKNGRNHPTPLALGVTPDRISAGALHTCSLQGGSASCWGAGAFGQLGDGSTTPATDTPVDVLNLTNVIQIAAGRRHTCAVLTSGEGYCWGDDREGQLGDGKSGTGVFSAIPVAVGGITDALAISAGGNDRPGGEHSCALRKGGKVSCWGAGSYGQLGNADAVDHVIPLEVPIPSALSVQAGGEFSCALHEDGSVSCWGRGDGGRLGDGTGTTPSAPVRVLGLGP